MKSLPMADTGEVLMPSRFKMVVLDYDLSSVINDVDFYEAFCEALREINNNPTSFNEFSEMLETNYIREFVRQNTNEELFWRRFRQLYISRHSLPRRGLREFLLLVKSRDIKVVVISGRETHSKYIWWDLRRHGLDDFIDDVITMYESTILQLREEFLFDKSSLIEYAKRKHGVAGGFVCIGDYIADYYSCIKAGGVFIGIGSDTRTSILKKAGVQHTAKDFYEVIIRLSEIGFLD